ncbi:hypothetical protein [Nesterenkonia populi]|uniref:hypothetical protein n=1 Tax=Nesterenkonia populi TaxID=1591087 RepID=UPI0011BF24A8|nr:hypothetical protein [Nesterenkonia populi]
MVPEASAYFPVVPPMPLGTLVGPLLIGAAVLALIGLGAVWVSGSGRSSGRLAAGDRAQQLPAGEQDPLDEHPTDELRKQAGSLLVSADNAVQESEQELLFASAAYGQEKVEPFQEDIDQAKEHLRESFHLQHQVDSARAGREELDEQTVRERLKQIIRHCEQISETLDSHQDQFNELRSLERNPDPAIEKLAERISELAPRREASERALEELARAYDDEALRQYRDNLAQSAEALKAAEDARAEAASAVERGETSEAVLTLHSGEQAAADAGELVDSLEHTEERLRTARKNLEIGIAQTETDIAQAKAVYEAGQGHDLAGPVAAAETAVRRAKDALASGGRIDPLELLEALEIAHRELDEPLNAVRDQQAKDRRAREVLDHELLTARNQVQSSVDYLRSRRYGISATSRTRMAEAERRLAEAESRGAGEPARAVEAAQQAKQLAVQAAQIAQREQAEANLGGSGNFGPGYQTPGAGMGRPRYGTGGGFGGGFGMGMGYGRRSPMGSAMRTARMANRMSGGRRRRGLF